MTKIFAAALVGVSALAISAGSAFAEYQLNILHTNDLHSRIEPITKYDSTCAPEDDAAGECFGGVARLKTAIDQTRAGLSGQNVLLLDAGDQFQGSLFYTQYKSGPVAEFMNAMGYDAMAIGNHEFDDGPEELLKLIDAVDFPIISGNTVPTDDSILKDKYKGYVIKDIGGEKVAIVSVLATDTGETSSPGPTITFEDDIAYLKKAVSEIEAEGVNKIILLSHVGYPRDQEIAAQVDGIDVIVGGHSHTLLSNTDDKAAGPYPTKVTNPAGVEVPIVTAYAYSKYLGDLNVTFDDNGVVTAASGDPILLDASFQPDEAIAARVEELNGPLTEIKKKIVGEATAEIVGDRTVCRAAECPMGDLVADAMLDRVADQGITIAIQNGGGVRASIGAGTVTMGDVLTVLPFQNTIATFQLKGSDVVAALENGLSQIEDGAGRYPQVSGLNYTYDSTKAPGSRIVSVEVDTDGDGDFSPIEPDTVYGVVSNNYMRAGGDGYSIFAEKGMNAYDFGPNLEDAVAAYIGANSPYTPAIDGRITDVSK
ncbi:multifunctional 2',3'-cyclic-nucleotide 2'-phosphodiesterase/5'-nucleotidase/3'-nucleotidase [Martelella alba]|uniref:Multifunctional 2',3'-cyclic-nucleotide 2'-phosphodiesterase/5'-nucleotidase/3'-nucleotidase n=1 Tax=Martelella alba TaxID=2590451 RepID=A0A506UDR6_9HYPH|nr:bifunctional metallophosphatase/5'-nucleotidase [Martelella alba]TPW31094.1 multifunctional 2',3'-cyclic-nucleotide 2'-phosphodiesterase/5'-nucleotidase/3'-nucleotidase [Martelella alba]